MSDEHARTLQEARKADTEETRTMHIATTFGGTCHRGAEDTITRHNFRRQAEDERPVGPPTAQQRGAARVAHRDLGEGALECERPRLLRELVQVRRRCAVPVDAQLGPQVIGDDEQHVGLLV